MARWAYEDNEMRIGMTTAEQVTTDLRRRILLGELRPGQRLKIDEIATLCGVSHMPVRTALQDLESEGILTVHPRRGAEIKVVDPEYITNVLEVRSAVEAMLAGKCARVIKPDEIEELKMLEDRFIGLVSDGDAMSLLRANFNLHNYINCVPRNSEALHTLNRGRLLIETLRVRVGYGGDRIRTIVDEHHQLVEAISNHEELRARDIAQHHCDGARDELLELIAKKGGGLA